MKAWIEDALNTVFLSGGPILWTFWSIFFHSHISRPRDILEKNFLVENWDKAEVELDSFTPEQMVQQLDGPKWPFERKW